MKRITRKTALREIERFIARERKRVWLLEVIRERFIANKSVDEIVEAIRNLDTDDIEMFGDSCETFTDWITNKIARAISHVEDELSNDEMRTLRPQADEISDLVDLCRLYDDVMQRITSKQRRTS